VRLPEAESRRSGSGLAIELLVALGLFDIGLGLMLVFFWVAVAEVAELVTTLVLVGLRGLATLVVFIRELAPLRRWTEGKTLTDTELLAADGALHRLETRFVLVYVLAWELSLIGSLVGGQLGPARTVALGRAELATAIAMLITLAAASLLIRELLRALTLTVLRQLSVQLRKRTRVDARRRSSTGTSMRLTVMAIVLGSLPGLTMLGGFVHIQGRRAEASMDQLRRAEVASLTGLEAGLREPEGVELVDAAALPEALARAELVDGTRRGYDRDRERALAAVELGDGRWLMASAPVDEQLGWIVAIAVLTTLISGALSMLISAALWRSQRELLAELGEATRRVAERGDIGALGRLVPLRNDEFGRLAQNFNDMLDILEELASAAADVARGDLRVELDHPGELHDAFRGMLAQISRVVARLRETARELTATARQLQDATRSQAEVGDEQLGVVGQVAVSVAALVEAAEDIEQRAGQVLGDAEASRDATDQVIVKIGEFRSHAVGIVDALEQIREVAERSDLLALNGSLEAVRAGEAGRGFGLVAAEMRRLAERTAEVVAEVRVRIDDIQSSSTGSLEVTAQSRALAERTADAARKISTVTHEQSQETDEVSTALNSVALAVSASTAATEQTQAVAEGLRAQAEELEGLLSRFEL